MSIEPWEYIKSPSELLKTQEYSVYLIYLLNTNKCLYIHIMVCCSGGLHNLKKKKKLPPPQNFFVNCGTGTSL